MKRYNYTDRPFGGSEEPRFCVDLNDNGLNAKHGPKMGNPAVHETSTRSGPMPNDAARRRRIGLSPKFVKD